MLLNGDASTAAQRLAWRKTGCVFRELQTYRDTGTVDKILDESLESQK